MGIIDSVHRGNLSFQEPPIRGWSQLLKKQINQQTVTYYNEVREDGASGVPLNGVTREFWVPPENPF